MRLSAFFCGRAHFVCLKKFLKKFPKIFGIFSRLRITPRKGEAPPTFNKKGGENVEPNSREFYKQCAFQKFCNTVLHNEACDTHRELRRHKAKEVTFSDMTLLYYSSSKSRSKGDHASHCSKSVRIRFNHQ